MKEAISSEVFIPFFINSNPNSNPTLKLTPNVTLIQILTQTVIFTLKKVNKKCAKKYTYFNRFACFWPKGYQLGSLGKSHQNGDYLKQAMRKIVFPQESNLQPLDYRSTALPLELEKTPPRMLNFGYLNPATCLLYDCNNKSIKMFRPEARKTIKILKLWPANVKKHLN